MDNVREVINTHQYYLVNNIENVQYLLELLYLNQVINFTEMKSITSQDTERMEQVEKLLNIIKEKSDANSVAFHHFLNALDRTGQIHLSSILVGTIVSCR